MFEAPEPPLLTFELLATAPITVRLHILPGVYILTRVHGPHRIYADVSLVSHKASYPVATLSQLIPTAAVSNPVGAGDFVIAAGATLAFAPAAPSAPGQVRIDACFVTPTARTPYKGQIASWPFA